MKASSVLIMMVIMFAQISPASVADPSRKIGSVVQEAVSEHEIPGMIAAISSSEGILAIGAAGVRKNGEREEISVHDAVHLGSCTKAMTSALVATYVGDGTITWDTTILEAMPKLAKHIHPEYHNITVWQLLTHQGRLPANAASWWAHGDQKLHKRRIAILKDNLKEAPAVAEDTYLYSNLGYMVAACILEEQTGDTWEEMIEERLFEPLNMDSAGFGPPGKKGRVEQPWGHTRSGASWKASQKDNDEALGPAGTVHCTVEDWVKFLALQLPGNRGEEVTLNSSLLKKLVTPNGEYAGGWLVLKRSWGKGTVLTHSGSNTMWYATVWVAPEIDRAFIVVTNGCDSNSGSINDTIIGELIRLNSKLSL